MVVTVTVTKKPLLACFLDETFVLAPGDNWQAILAILPTNGFTPLQF